MSSWVGPFFFRIRRTLLATRRINFQYLSSSCSFFEVDDVTTTLDGEGYGQFNPRSKPTAYIYRLDDMTKSKAVESKFLAIRRLNPEWYNSLKVKICKSAPDGTQGGQAEVVEDTLLTILNRLIAEGPVSLGTDALGDLKISTGSGVYKFSAIEDAEGNPLARAWFDLWFNKQVGLSSCLFFHVRNSHCLDWPLSGEQFFIVSGGTIVEESFSLNEDAGKKGPVSRFLPPKNEHIWSNERGDFDTYIKQMYLKFYRSTETGRSLFFQEHGTYPEDFAMVQTTKSLHKISRDLNILKYLAVAMLVAATVLRFMP